MATRNANNTDFGTQFGGTTLTVFDTLGASGADAQTALLVKIWKSLFEAVQKSQLFCYLVRLVAVHLKFT